MGLYTRATIVGRPTNSVLKVIALNDLLRWDFHTEHCALWVDDNSALARSRAIEELSWGALIHVGTAYPSLRQSTCHISQVRSPATIAPGDVIAVRADKGLITSLYRRSSKSNALLVTERCNSYCLMCSQPPLERDESGRVDELIATVRLMDREEQVLGITGGEPTLLGEDLFRLFGEIRTCLPTTALHVLSNGRRFEDRTFAKSAVAAAPRETLWAIPLYSDSPDIHDFVVQSEGAFKETLGGLWNLAGESAHVELRVVLQCAVIPRIRQLAHFIARNLSFVKHVAWMGLEPMGFAKPNWKSIWAEPHEYTDTLAEAVEKLDHFGVATSVFNLPLCVLPARLRPYATQSISDWKNVYLDECATCLARDKCCGFFSSATGAYLPKSVHALRDDIKLEPSVTSQHGVPHAVTV